MSNYDGHIVHLGDPLLTGQDEYGVDWRGIDLGGWYGASGSSISPTQKTRAPGAWGGPRQQTPKSIPLSGYLVAPSAAAARDAIDRLNGAVSLYETPLTVSEIPTVPPRYSMVVQQDEVLTKYETDTLVSWSIQMVALDPRKFSRPLTGETGLPHITGGLAIPFSLPTTTQATVTSGIVSLTNAGTTNGKLTARITGPVASPRITHVQTGRVIELAGLTLNAGEYVDIDMEAQTVLATGGVSRNTYLSSRQWLPFLPGNNSYSLYSPYSNNSARLTITATPSWK